MTGCLSVIGYGYLLIRRSPREFGAEFYDEPIKQPIRAASILTALSSLLPQLDSEKGSQPRINIL